MHPRRLEGRILKAVNRANRDFLTVQPDDRILVAVSGGKDSFAMLWALQKLQAAHPFKIELVAFHLDLIDLSSIDIWNGDRTLHLEPEVDYRVLNTGGFVEIQILPGSRVEESAELLVSYRYEVTSSERSSLDTTLRDLRKGSGLSFSSSGRYSRYLGGRIDHRKIVCDRHRDSKEESAGPVRSGKERRAAALV